MRGRAGQATGGCRHGGALDMATPAPSHPVLSGTSVCWVCSAWPSGTIPVTVPGGELQAQGVLAGPPQMLWCRCRSRATMVGSHRHVQPHANPLPLLGTGGCRGITPPGHSTAAQHRDHQPGHEELTQQTTLCQGQVGFSLSCRRGQQGTEGGWEQPAIVTVEFCQTSPTSFSWLLGFAIRQAKGRKPLV